MASAVETQVPIAMGGSAIDGMMDGGIHKNLSQATLRPNPPPSPPATETDTETDSDAPNTPQSQLDPRARIASPSLSRGMEMSTPDSNVNNASPVTSPITSPITSPPYWMNNHSNHTRAISSTSVDSIPTGGIVLRDNENSELDDRGSACWAKSVEITDYVTVNGSTTNIGAFVVWNIRVGTLSGSYINIRKRYSEFDDFRWRLIRTFPNFEAAVPELPPKSIVSKFRPKFLEKRRAGLQYFMNCVLLNPEFSGSPVLKEFLFS
ncbi:Phox-like protein [Annulohypoxylon truncatum]|uniref:Phox-like protein n=1 Tax=Annulohypoxylon truncatum TaxID=327061 RepID=UPI002008819D|nr:Phox-like protein [Annulohypoxylon truncatum]KAI1209142.1 Phox-like protein [Annulohypoxylon truncatum]